MSNYTLSERTLLHLYKYRHLSPTVQFGAPLDITQDGIAETLGISRSHAALLANRLEDQGLLTSRKAKVKGGTQRVPRKIYMVTPLGINRCEELFLEMKTDNLDEDQVIAPNNINYCRSTVFWSLPQEEQVRIGCMLVLRIPVRRSDFINDPPSMVPFDFHGRMSIHPDTKKWYITRVDTETLKKWHSAAADWCTDRNLSPKERLYHLHRSGRKREAVKLIDINRYMFMDFPDRESRDLTVVLASEMHDDNLLLIATRMSLKLSDLDMAHRILSSVADRNSTSAIALRSELLLAEGCPAKALDLILDAYVGDVETAAAMGMCMVANGRSPEALTYIRRCMNEMRRTGCVFRLDDVLAVKAEALAAVGDEDGAKQALELSKCWKKDPSIR